MAAQSETQPDPRVVEDLIARGEISLIRSFRDDESYLQAVNQAAQWLLERVRRELREARGRG